MTSAEVRLSILETRVSQLETWAGPGQIEALLAGIRGIRGDITVMRRVQDRHSRQLAGLKTDVAGLKTDVAGLKTDVAELKLGIREILRRLPEPPA
jgi:hypothetical protein